MRLAVFTHSSKNLLLGGWVIVTTLAAGCGSNKTAGEDKPQGFPAAQASTEELPTAVNLNYANWKQFPEGTVVTRVKTTKNAQDWVKETTTLKLLHCSSEKVMVESQVTVERPNYETKINPGATIEFPASFKLPKGLTSEQIQAPSLRAKNAGVEKLQVLNKSCQATVFIWEDGTESGPMVNKAWYVDTIPGRIARQEMQVEQKGFSALEEVVAIVIPGPNAK